MEQRVRREGKTVLSYCNTLTTAFQNVDKMGTRKTREKGRTIRQNDLQNGNQCSRYQCPGLIVKKEVCFSVEENEV